MEYVRLTRPEATLFRRTVTITTIWLIFRGFIVLVGLTPPFAEDAVLLATNIVAVIWMAADAYLARQLLVRLNLDLVDFNAVSDMGPRAGYVYLVKGPKGYYKIGRSKNPSDRNRTFKLNLPFDIEYEHLVLCQDMHAAETKLHRVFAHRRSPNTEWFSLSPDDVAVIKSIKEM